MQLRWIAIGVVCFSATLLSACGNAGGDRLSGRSAATMSKSAGRYDSSTRDEDDMCDDWKNYDESRSLSASSSMDDDECKESDDSDRSWSSSSDDDDDSCRVTVCHVSSDTTCTAHMIRVRQSEVEAHIEHGDYPGACVPVDPPPPPPQCLPDSSVCNVDADCCPGSICLPDPLQGTACGVPG
jgi:hypothetical protein